MKTLNQHIVACLLVLGFLTAGISPACHFVNGQMMSIEICKADGSVETIEVATGEEQGTPSQHQSKDECMYCYAFAAGKAIKAPAPQLIAAVPAQYLRNSGGLIIPQGLQAKHIQTTGPPNSVV